MAAVLIKRFQPDLHPQEKAWLRIRQNLAEMCAAINEYLPHASEMERSFLWSMLQGYRLQISAIETFQLPEIKKSLTNKRS